MPPEGILFYLAVFILLAVISFAGLVVGLKLARGKHRGLGLSLVSICAILLVLLAIFVTYVYTH